MSTIDIEVVFEGPGVEAGTIRATLLADALNGSAEVFARANQIANGDASEAVVFVRTEFTKGSFSVQLQLAQELVEHAKQLITTHPFFDATTLSYIIGFLTPDKNQIKASLIELYKWLKGKKPDRAFQIGNNDIELTVGQSYKTVNTTIFNFYGDSAVREGMTRLTNPLRQGAIDRVVVKHNGTEQTAIDKQEAAYFEPEPIQLEPDGPQSEGERDAILIVSKLSFKEGTPWTFFERGAIVNAKIEDAQFWVEVHQHKHTFGEGDMLRVHLRWKIVKRNTLIARNTISKVYEVLQSANQLLLGDI